MIANAIKADFYKRLRLFASHFDLFAYLLHTQNFSRNHFKNN